VSSAEIENQKTFQLTSPITVEGNTVSELTIREPKLFELEFAEKTAGKGNYELMRHLISAVSSKDSSVIRNLGARDYRAIAAFLSSFLADDQTTGEKS
jgi:hypothetical protein